MSISFPGPNGPIRLTGPVAAFLRRSQTGGTPPPAADLAAGTAAAREYLARLVRPEYVSLPFRGPHDLDNWTGETWEIRRAYRALLLKEPAVKAALKSKVAAVASLAPQVLPEDKASPRDRAAARFVDWAIGRSHGGWPGVVRVIAAGALIDGFSVCEKVLAPVTARAWPGFWGLDELAPLDTRYIRLDVDPYKRVTAVRCVRGQAAQAFDPRDFTVYAYQALWGSPFGLSDLRAAYRPAALIEAAVRLRAVLLENFAGPFLVGTYQPGDQGQKEELLAVLREARATGYVVVPDGDEVTVLNLATSADAQFGSAIEDYRKEIYTAIRGAYLPFSEGAAGARVGNSRVHQGVADLDAWDLAVDVAEVVNRQLVPDLVRPNFGDGVGLPRVSLGARDPETVLKTLEVVKAVQAAGVPVSAAFIYEASGVEPPAGPDDVAGGGAGGPPPADRAFAEMFYDESQHPRDDDGRWTKAGRLGVRSPTPGTGSGPAYVYPQAAVGGVPGAVLSTRVAPSATAVPPRGPRPVGIDPALPSAPRTIEDDYKSLYRGWQDQRRLSRGSDGPDVSDKAELARRRVTATAEFWKQHNLVVYEAPDGTQTPVTALDTSQWEDLKDALRERLSNGTRERLLAGAMAAVDLAVMIGIGYGMYQTGGGLALLGGGYLMARTGDSLQANLRTAFDGQPHDRAVTAGLRAMYEAMGAPPDAAQRSAEKAELALGLAELVLAFKLGKSVIPPGGNSPPVVLRPAPVAGLAGAPALAELTAVERVTLTAEQAEVLRRAGIPAAVGGRLILTHVAVVKQNSDGSSGTSGSGPDAGKPVQGEFDFDNPGQYKYPPPPPLAEVPTVRGGAFHRWFNKLTPQEIRDLWANKSVREAIEERLRSPGGFHEWLPVSRAPKFREWGVTAEQIHELRTATSEVHWKAGGAHGGTNSTTMHNEILQLVDASQDFASFVSRLQVWAEHRLVGGAAALPPGLAPKITGATQYV